MEQEIEVSPSRLARSEWCHRRSKRFGEGDICTSYSADRIASERPVRKPYLHEGQKWVCVGSSGSFWHGYRLIHPTYFEGDTFTYGERVRDAQNGRNDRSGLYHGMQVKHGGNVIALPQPQFGQLPISLISAL